MPKKEEYFFISGAFSTIFSFSILFFVFYYISNINIIKKISVNQEINIEFQALNIGSYQKASKTKEEKSSASYIKRLEENYNINDLFKSIKTKKVDNKKIELKRRLLRKTRLKEIIEKDKKNLKKLSELSKKVNIVNSKINFKMKVKNLDKQSGEFNEYFAKIQTMVFANWFPAKGNIGKIIKLNIKINNYGKLSFSFIKTPNINLKNDLIKHLDTLKDTIFPLPKGKKNINLKFIIKIKEDY